MSWILLEEEVHLGRSFRTSSLGTARLRVADAFVNGSQSLLVLVVRDGNRSLNVKLVHLRHGQIVALADVRCNGVVSNSRSASPQNSTSARKGAHELPEILVGH